MKKSAGGVLIACAVGLILVLCLQASGSIIVFTSRDEWQAANNGDVDFFQDFNAFNIAFDAGVPKNIAFPGFSILQDPGFAINFAGNADLFASDLTPLTFAFNFSLFGFGGDFSILDGVLELETLGETHQVAVGRSTFFGILSDQPFNAINFTNFVQSPDITIAADANAAHFRLDNVSLAQTQVVPEPASVIIWGAGFFTTAGYVAMRRRWRQRCEKV